LVSKDTNASLSQATTITNGENGSSPKVRGSALNDSTPDVRYSSTRHALHKAASSTFKFVSDTIRSKTQLFYVESARPETPYPIESVNTKRERRSRLLSSLRSRSSRSDRVDPTSHESGTTGRSSISFTPCPDIPHELHVDIPDPKLLEDESTNRGDSSEVALGDFCIPPVQESPSPPDQPVRSTASPIYLYADGAGSEEEVIESEGNFRSRIRSPIHISEGPPKQEITAQEACSADSGVNAVEHRGEAPPLAKGDDPETLHAIELSKRPRVGGSLFVKGNREQLRRSGTPSPYQRALRSSESLEVVLDGPSQPQIAPTAKHTSDKVTVLSRPTVTVTRTTSFPRGLSNMMDSEKEVSDDYDGDTGSSDEDIEEPSMGPRSPWDKIRADREKRYSVVRSMSVETTSIGSNESGLELRRFGKAPPLSSSPICCWKDRKVHFEVPEDANTTSTDSSFVQTSVKYNAESPANSTNTKFINDATDQPNDRQIPDNTRSHDRCVPESSMLHDVEAIEIQNGMDVDRFEKGPVDFADAETSWGNYKQESVLLQPVDLPQNSRFLVRPAQNRQSSSISVATAESCAITTSSPLSYSPVLIPTLHLHTTPVRQTSGTREELHRIRIEKESEGSFVVEPVLRHLELGPIGLLEVHSFSPTGIRNAAYSDTEGFGHDIEQVEDSKVTGHQTNYSVSKPSSKTRINVNNLFKPEEASLSRNDVRPDEHDHGASDNSFSSSVCAQNTDFVVEPANLNTSIESSPREPQENDLRKWVKDSEEKSVFQPATDSNSQCIDLMLQNDDRSTMSEILGSEVEVSSPWRSCDLESLLGCSPKPGNMEGDSDFLAANPELGEYLDQNFSVYSSEDGDAGFRTPISSPRKMLERAKRESIYSQLQTVTNSEGPSDEYLRLHSLKSTYSQLTQTSCAENLKSGHVPSGTLTEEEILMLRDITPIGPSDAASPSQQDLQTSSIKKGVWWGRNGEPVKEDDSPLAGKDDSALLSKPLDTTDQAYHDVEVTMQRAESHQRMIQCSIEDMRAMLSAADTSDSDGDYQSDTSSAHETSIARRHSSTDPYGNKSVENSGGRESTSNTPRKNSVSTSQPLFIRCSLTLIMLWRKIKNMSRSAIRAGVSKRTGRQARPPWSPIKSKRW
jgi:hypothetical protein